MKPSTMREWERSGYGALTCDADSNRDLLLDSNWTREECENCEDNCESEEDMFGVSSWDFTLTLGCSALTIFASAFLIVSFVPVPLSFELDYNLSTVQVYWPPYLLGAVFVLCPHSRCRIGCSRSKLRLASDLTARRAGCAQMTAVTCVPLFFGAVFAIPAAAYTEFSRCV